MSRKTLGGLIAIIGAILIVAGLALMLVVVPGMKQFPEDVDTTRSYSGTMPVLLNAESFEFMTDLDVELSRHFRTEEVDGDVALVFEEQFLLTGGQPLQQLVKHYAIDRKTMEFADTYPEEWASREGFWPREGLVLGWPIGTEKKDYVGWSDDFRDTVTLGFAEEVQHDRAGITTYYFAASAPPKLIHPDAVTAMGLPNELPKEQFAALIQGAAVSDALKNILPVLLDQWEEETIPLQYYYEYEAEYWIEPETGVLIDTRKHELRKVGFSKERRVDPQIVVGLLVDREGFPLEVGCFEGDHAETRTIVPIVKAFAERHRIADMVVVADAGMLSGKNLTALDDAQLRFIVGSKTTKAPLDLASHFRWHGDAFTDGQIIDTITAHSAAHPDNDPALRAEPVWDRAEHPGSWRAVWAYSAKRAVRDGKVLTAQENRARAVIAGEKTARTPRFVKNSNGTAVLDEASLARARRLVGLKGYVTNIPADVMPPAEVISSYHDLWHVEQSFRMSKTDLRARPMFARTKDAIEAHLTIVFTALAVAREAQNRTGLAIRNLVRQLRTLRSATIAINGAVQTIPPAISPQQHALLDALQRPRTHALGK
mgnify:CR=1 FL=1